MDTISDDDLILYHYRDGLAPERLAEIETALAAMSEVRERYEAIVRTLSEVDALPAPTADADFAQRLWRQLEPRLRADDAIARRRTWRDYAHALHVWLNPPRLAWAAACVLALAVGIGFYAGRQSAPTPDALAQSRADAAAMRVLDAYVAEHLRATEGVLVTASNSDSTELLDGNRELAASLVEANRMYATAATRAGNTRLADFLRQLEPVLISLANPSQSAPVQPTDGLRDYLRATDLLFQVRATEARLQRTGERRT